MSDRFAGTLALTRLALRRDRVLIAVWLYALTAFCAASAILTVRIYPDLAQQVDAAKLINGSTALVALYGPILDPRSLGEVAMSKATVMYAMFVMILALVLVRRHTRVEEESGRAELIGATAVGPAAPMAAALLVTASVLLLLAVLCGIADIVGGLPVQGSLLFAASWLGIGLVAVGITAVAAQVSSSARACGALALSAIAVLYLLRAVGDNGPEALSWISPLGWGTRLRPWGDPRWWVLPLYVVVAATLTAAAVLLRQHRDLGSGLLSDRPGPATASPRLRDALSLELRLQRSQLLWWTVGFAVMAALFGSIAPNLGSLLTSGAARASVEALGGRGRFEDSILGALLTVMALIVTAYSLIVISAAANDEGRGLTEQVLASGTSRARNFAALVAVALGGTAWLLLVTGAAAGLTFVLQSDQGSADLPRVIAAALAHAPAIWVTAGVGLLGLGISPRLGWLGSAALATFVLLGDLGPLFELPDWVLGLSPYHHVPQMPAADFAVVPEAVLVAVAAVLVGLAWWRYRSRDIG